MLKQTITPLMGQFLASATITFLATQDNVIGVVRTTSRQWNKVVDFITAAQFTLTPPTAPMLRFVLKCYIRLIVRTFGIKLSSSSPSAPSPSSLPNLILVFVSIIVLIINVSARVTSSVAALGFALHNQSDFVDFWMCLIISTSFSFLTINYRLMEYNPFGFNFFAMGFVVPIILTQLNSTSLGISCFFLELCHTNATNYTARVKTVFLTAIKVEILRGRGKLFAAFCAAFHGVGHSILVNADSWNVCSQGGTRTAFSGISLDYTCNYIKSGVNRKYVYA